MRVRVIGPLLVHVDGRRARDLPGGRASSLLGLLAADAGHMVPTGRIIEDLWPGNPPAKPEQNVASLVSRLRRLVGRDCIEGGRSGYRLVLSDSVSIDLADADKAVSEAEARLAAGSSASAAAAAREALVLLDAGELLEDELYAAWTEGPRRRAERLQRRARRCLWTAGFELDDTAAALGAATAAVEADLFDEEAARALMRANHRRGDRSAALVAFKRLESHLHEELGVAPADETLELHQAIVGGLPEPARSPATGIDGGGGGRRVPLVGRAEELDRLRDAWGAAVGGRGGAVFVCGAAGSGKSRLAAEVVALVEVGGGVALRARCNEAERSLFLQPILEAIRGHLERTPPDVARQLAGNWAGTLAELLPGLADLLQAGPYESVAPELEHRRSLEAVTELFARVAHRQPALLVVEDLEHAGASTLEALRFMTGRLGNERFLLLVTLRPEEARDALETLEDLGRRIQLGPLPEAAVRRLATVMGVPELAGPIYRLTGGDVLFSVEAFRLAADSDRAADALEVARSLREVVVERIRRAGDEIEEFLRVAAVAGVTFDIDLVGRVQNLDPARAARLAERGVQAGLLTSKGDSLAFANRVIHEVLYDTTPPAVRASRHRRIAELVADRPELVAVHQEAAGDWAKATAAWTAAADDAQRRFANRDAERLLTAALGCAEKASADRDGHQRTGPDKNGGAGTIAQVSLRRGQVREELADYAGARDDHHRALSLARDSGDTRMEAMALERLGWTAYYGRDADTAGDLAAQATGLAEQAAAAPGALPSALVLVGRVRHWAGDMAGAASAYSDALVGAEPSTVASALSCLGALLEHGDRFEEANDVLARAMAQCEETGSFRALLRTLFFAGLARANLGDLVGALRVLERKRGLLERYDVHFYRARTSTTLSWVWRELGDRGRAEELAQMAIEQSREVTAGQLQTEQELHALLALAECRLLDDDPGRAADLVAEAEPLIRNWLPFRWRAELRLVEMASRLEPERAELLLDLSRQRGSAKYQALALGRLGRREEAAKMAATTGSPLLVAEVAPEAQARDAIQAVAAAVPRDMRSRFVRQGRLTGPLRGRPV